MKPQTKDYTCTEILNFYTPFSSLCPDPKHRVIFNSGPIQFLKLKPYQRYLIPKKVAQTSFLEQDFELHEDKKIGAAQMTRQRSIYRIMMWGSSLSNIQIINVDASFISNALCTHASERDNYPQSTNNQERRITWMKNTRMILVPIGVELMNALSRPQ